MVRLLKDLLKEENIIKKALEAREEFIGFAKETPQANSLRSEIEEKIKRAESIEDNESIVGKTLPLPRLLAFTNRALDIVLSSEGGGVVLKERYGTGKTHMLKFLKELLEDPAGVSKAFFDRRIEILERDDRLSRLVSVLEEIRKKASRARARVIAKGIRREEDKKPLRDIILKEDKGRDYAPASAAEEIHRRLGKVVLILDEYQERRNALLAGDNVKANREFDFLKRLAEKSLVIISANETGTEDPEFDEFMRKLSGALERAHGGIKAELKLDPVDLARLLDATAEDKRAEVDPLSLRLVHNLRAKGDNLLRNELSTFIPVLIAMRALNIIDDVAFSIAIFPAGYLPAREKASELIVKAFDRFSKAGIDDDLAKIAIKAIVYRTALSETLEPGEDLEELRDILKILRIKKVVPKELIKSLFRHRYPERELAKLVDQGYLRKENEGYGLPDFFFFEITEEVIRALSQRDARDIGKMLAIDIEGAVKEYVLDSIERALRDYSSLVEYSENPQTIFEYNVEIDDELYEKIASDIRKLFREKLLKRELVRPTSYLNLLRETIEDVLEGLRKYDLRPYYSIVTVGEKCSVSEYIRKLKGVKTKAKKTIRELCNKQSGVGSLKELAKLLGVPEDKVSALLYSIERELPEGFSFSPEKNLYECKSKPRREVVVEEIKTLIKSPRGLDLSRIDRSIKEKKADKLKVASNLEEDKYIAVSRNKIYTLPEAIEEEIIEGRAYELESYLKRIARSINLSKIAEIVAKRILSGVVKESDIDKEIASEIANELKMNFEFSKRAYEKLFPIIRDKLSESVKNEVSRIIAKEKAKREQRKREASKAIERPRETKEVKEVRKEEIPREVVIDPNRPEELKKLEEIVDLAKRKGRKIRIEIL